MCVSITQIGYNSSDETGNIIYMTWAELVIMRFRSGSKNNLNVTLEINTQSQTGLGFKHCRRKKLFA